MQTEKEFYKDNKELKDTVELVSLLDKCQLKHPSHHFPFQMTRIQTYKDKLIAIKKEMGNIHNRTKNLKRKANGIKDFKLKQLNHP